MMPHLSAMTGKRRQDLPCVCCHQTWQIHFYQLHSLHWSWIHSPNKRQTHHLSPQGGNHLCGSFLPILINGSDGNFLLLGDCRNKETIQKIWWQAQKNDALQCKWCLSTHSRQHLSKQCNNSPFVWSKLSIWNCRVLHLRLAQFIRKQLLSDCHLPAIVHLTLCHMPSG